MKKVDAKKVRYAFQTWFKQVMDHKGISLKNLTIYNDNGEKMSQSSLSLILANKRNMSLWVSMQLLKHLDTSLIIHEKSVRFIDSDIVQWWHESASVPVATHNDIARDIIEYGGVDFVHLHKFKRKGERYDKQIARGHKKKTKRTDKG